MKKYTIAFDVGGTFIKTAVLDESGRLLPDTYRIYPSKSKETKEVILGHFAEMIREQTHRITDPHFRIDGIGFAFPGPFDYERGICRIRGVDKFESLYGVNLRKELTGRLRNASFFRNKPTPEFRIVFENDTRLFALGEYAAGKAGRYRKSICVTIGTGAGSAFLENGQLVKDRPDVPPDGWIYNQPYRDSIVDDHISNRGFLRLMRDAGYDTAKMDMKRLAELAMAGDPAAAGVFRRFGGMIGEALAPFVRSFRPEAVVIGGQIAKSGHLFLDATREKLQDFPVALEVTDETSVSTFVGVFRLLEQQKKIAK